MIDDEIDMKEFDLKAFLAARKEHIDQALEEYLPAPVGLEKSVIEAARYSLFAGGKRLRPILCIQAAEVVGGTADMVMPVACAMEMIHTYSLIHDDLPAMDNDDFRRGQPTNHKVFGEAIAILAGDALLTEAFGLIAATQKDERVPPQKILQAIGIVTKASGYRGMIGGQVIDLECETREVDLATVEYMHIHKTGAILSACLELGALLGGGSTAEVAALVKYGQHFGLAFQITDDLLDVEGDAALMGKQPGSDLAKNKKTYPALLGLAKSRESAKAHVEAALTAVSAFEEGAEPLRAIARYLLVRKA
ncbi:polyprenyl synthetase family protein [Desulfoferrobacter suflitae]|uniref:polyprenyl synthetase family protein n=1 Tax=Desulfoferrobacter suflitae TaxID=2865782 RepID=UPI00216445AB|nr:farnesyl diphosphate synthase [Desulfoferrobacter suflitae]MCK8602718.1 polyprenyl synthetase family protein [Desulfoferrobacter suflitae]